MLHVIHRRDTMDAARFPRALERARDRALKVGQRAPPRIEAQNLAGRFRQHGAAYFRFITTPGIEPTNNPAEQAIRFVVQDRHVTQGTRSPRGRRWCERISCGATAAPFAAVVVRTVARLQTAQPWHPAIPPLSSGARY